MSKEPDYKVPSKAQRKLCLVVVDMQNCFFNDDESSKIENKKEIENIVEAIRLFHEHNRQVFIVKYVGETHSICKDMNFIDELGDIEPCTVVEKHHMSAFQNTCLTDLMIEGGYDSALVCGAYAEYCVMATYWSAQEHDMSPYLLAGGVIAYSKERQKAAEDICSTYTMEELRENLETTTVERDPTSARMRRKYWYIN